MTDLKSEQIYEAALAEDALERLPELIARSIGGRSSVICWFHDDGMPEMLGFSHFGREQMKDYVENYTDHDLWALGAFSPSRLNSTTIGEHVATPRMFERSILHNEFFRKYRDDTWHCVGGAYKTAWGTALIGVHRGRRAGAFSVEERDKLASTIDHLKGALSLRGQLAAERRSLAMGRSALDAISTAIVLVDSLGGVVHVNAEAERLLSTDMGPFRLTGRTVASSDKRFFDAISLATLRAEPRAGSIAMRGEDGSEWLLTVTPADSGKALLAFRDPSSGRSSTKRALRQFFNLTDAEAEVAMGLSDGLGPEEIAAVRAVSMSTVHTQVRLLRTKMSVSRQSEIVSIVARINLIR